MQGKTAWMPEKRRLLSCPVIGTFRLATPLIILYEELNFACRMGGAVSRSSMIAEINAANVERLKSGPLLLREVGVPLLKR